MNTISSQVKDELLVLRAQGGDHDALAELVERWQDRLGRFAHYRTGHAEVARDVLQEAWMSIAAGLSKLDDPARFGHWAYRIVGNKCADWLRRLKHAREFEDQARNTVREGAIDADSGESEILKLRAALRTLPADDATILALHYLDEMGIADIGRYLDVPAGTVKSRLHYARNRLKEVLEREEREVVR